MKSHPKLRIRKARPQDAQTILDYLTVIGSESDNLTFGAEGLGYTVEEEAKTIETIKKSDNSVMFLGFIGKELVSVGNLGGKTRPRMKHYALLGLSVKKAYWNQGIGKAMMAQLVEFALSNPILEKILLEVRSDNVHAIRLYSAFGFHPIGTVPQEMKIDGVYYDTHLMVKEVKPHD